MWSRALCWPRPSLCTQAVAQLRKNHSSDGQKSLHTIDGEEWQFQVERQVEASEHLDTEADHGDGDSETLEDDWIPQLVRHHGDPVFYGQCLQRLYEELTAEECRPERTDDTNEHQAYYRANREANSSDCNDDPLLLRLETRLDPITDHW
eukprot:CAMPEP_0194508710 /NCGR_PEP_ID=MMETSP0253-20130528/39072_1 /TAXON_ID=2966 /ORGANISM="Noctiluca scintillans" /LENGTH=149 /DNA_ID=CAMNT_0039351779 /DNA_START=45 /DNA_END=494 /DNA_ORIENTATION=+